MKVPKKFFGFHYIFLETNCWRFYKIDDNSTNIINLTEHRNNFLKYFEEPFENISKILKRKYL